MVHQLHGVRIFTPDEYERLLEQVTKLSLRLLLQVMLFTGMRYEEVMRLKNYNPDLPVIFNEQDSNIWLRSGKVKASSPERYVALTEAGKLAVKAFLADDRMKYPSSSGMTLNLISWCKKAGLDPIEDDQMRTLAGANTEKERHNVYGMSVKAFRRTWENWLLTICPDRVFDIMKSQGHDIQTSSKHYAGAVFSQSDVSKIREYVTGWKPKA